LIGLEKNFLVITTLPLVPLIQISLRLLTQKIPPPAKKRIIQIKAMHLPGIVIQIVGSEMGDHSRSCEEHAVCSSILAENVDVHHRKVQVLVEGHEESAIICYWVNDGIDHCYVGFLMCCMVKHATCYDGVLAQVLSVLSADEKSAAGRSIEFSMQRRDAAMQQLSCSCWRLDLTI
jgi:hypothetical protein